MTSSAVRTAARVVSEIPGLPFSTRLTVASLTPACFATSASLPGTAQDYCKILQMTERDRSVERAAAAKRMRRSVFVDDVDQRLSGDDDHEAGGISPDPRAISVTGM